MNIRIIRTNKGIIINKVFTSCIIRGINIDNINLSFMCFLKQVKTVKIIALKQKIICPIFASTNFSFLHFRKYRNLRFHLNVNGFFVLLPYKSILFRLQFFFNLAQSNERIIICMLLFQLFKKSKHFFSFQL